MNTKYQNIITHLESCLAKHGDTCLGVDWPNKQDAEKRYQVMLEVVRETQQDSQSLLDFGCGASHLFGYMLNAGITGLRYYGLDASEKFCTLSRSKYPNNQYICLDILLEPDKLDQFDYVVMNGVFTEKLDLTFDEMFEYFKNVLRAIFSKVRKGIAFNVMSKAVDWERTDLFHLPTDMLIDFLVKELSRHFVIRNDYGLYEYTVYLYKEIACGDYNAPQNLGSVSMLRPEKGA
jgi:SAM-dependent methyltransferase